MSQSTRHERVTQLFLAASALAPEARGDFLDVECGDDLALRGEVEAMLVHDEHPPALLETPALGPEFKIMWQAPAEGPDAEDGIVGETAVMASSATSERPTQLGRYRITDTIAEGGVGIVYLAEQESPSRRVALKVLGPGSLSRRMLHRFEHEADILGRLRHPGIAQIFEAGVANAGFGPQPFFAMEYVAGCSLTEYVTAHKLSLRTRLELLVDICDAVHHAHQKGVVHRDLKPANIIVDESGRPKILDFGVARVTDADLHATTMHTERGQLLGTVPYMSPEQAAGDVRDIDVRSDVYALGVVAYEMLSGRMPYDVHELMLHDAVRTIQEVEPVPLGTVDRSLRGDVETIVAKALAKPRERRYQSASDLAADIKRFLAHEPITARPASSAYRLQRFARRHRSMVTGVGIAILAVLAGLATTTWQAITADRERNRAIVAERDAQQRFDQVRALANTFIFDVHDEIEQVPGTTAARRMMVETAIRYLDALAVEPIDDPTLRDEIADGYMKVGDVLGNPHRANLGDKDGALESYERALAIRRRLLDRAPESDDARLDVAESLRATASILTVTGKTAAAWERHEQAIGLAQDVLAVDPDHQRALREVATNKGLMGRLASKRGETELAAELLRHAVTTGQTLYDASPDDPTRIFALRGSLNQLAAVQQWAGQTAEALANYHRAHDLAERLCAIDPDNTRYRRALFTSRLGLGDVLSNSGRTDEALVEFEGALLAVRAAAASDPNDRRAQQDIGFACERIAYIHLRRGRHEAALAHFEEGRAARAAVVAASPEDTEASYNLAISTIQVGEAAAAVGRTEDALALFEDALARTEALYAVDPADFWYQDLIAVALQNVAETRVALGQLDEAQATYARMHEVATGLVDIDPDTAQNRGLLAHSLMGLGTVYEKQERYDDALVSYREGLRIREAIADQDAANAAARLEVGQSHEHLGDLLGFTMAEPVEGVAHYRAAIEIRESVAPAGPGARGRTAALAYDYSQLALVLSAVGEVNEGIEALSSCVELLEMVVQSEPTEAARRDLAEALERLAAAQATRARDAGAPTGDRVAGLEAACGHYEHALELLDDPALDASRRIREALAACRRALADLGNPVRQGGS